jgi:hypothetical protein
LRLRLRSAERFSDAAIALGSRQANTPGSRSSALLSRVTRADQRLSAGRWRELRSANLGSASLGPASLGSARFRSGAGFLGCAALRRADLRLFDRRLLDLCPDKLVTMMTVHAVAHRVKFQLRALVPSSAIC